MARLRIYDHSPQTSLKRHWNLFTNIYIIYVGGCTMGTMGVLCYYDVVVRLFV